MRSFASAYGNASSAKRKVPCSWISRAARTTAPNAARLSADPTLIRRTPRAASSATENDAFFKPITTLTGLRTAGYQFVAWGTTHMEEGKRVPVIARDAPA